MVAAQDFDTIQRVEIEPVARTAFAGKGRNIPGVFDDLLGFFCKKTCRVTELLRECVREKGPDAFVFTRETGERVVDPRDEWYNLCVRCGLGKYIPAKRMNGKEYDRYVGLNLHDFRRSAIRNMTRRGVNDTTAMNITGHKTRSVFMRYNIVDERDLAEASLLIERGRQAVVQEQQSDTKTDTLTYAHS